MKGLTIPVGVIFLACILLPACAPAPEPEVDLRAEEEALREFIGGVLVAYENRDGEAMAGMCDETFMNLGGILKGREDIEGLWKSFLGSLENTRLNILERLASNLSHPKWLSCKRASSSPICRLTQMGIPSHRSSILPRMCMSRRTAAGCGRGRSFGR